MRILRQSLTLLFTSAVIATLAAPAASSVQARTTTPTLTKAKCQFTLSTDLGQTEGKTYSCGMVTVPEDHAKPNGKTIQLAVAVFKSSAATPQSDPVIYLNGGPGGFTLNDPGFYVSSFKPLLDQRDLILFDQRGVGFSKPSLYCPEVTTLDHSLLATVLTPAEGAKRSTAATLACQKRLVAQGVNLSVYNTDQDAADVDSIRQALGYQTLNLYGISYGTRLALIIMRDFPKNVRSTVIDSVVPVEQQMLVGQIPATQRVFKQLWDGCAAETACNRSFPNLEKVFYQTVDRLNKKPVTLTATDPNDNKDYKVAIDGNALINTVFNTFYVTNVIPLLPAIIYAANRGNLDFVARLALAFADEDKTTSYAMYFSVECQEEVPFETISQIQAADSGVPVDIINNQLAGLQGEFDICNGWGVSKSPAVDKQPVKSTIPTLVMAGAYDPVTPPAYSKQVADEIGNSYFFEIPNSGHAASPTGDCPFSLVTSFIDTPTQQPDGSCIASIGAPKFQTQ